MKRIAALILLQLTLATSVAADLVNPATLVIKEIEPSRFTVALTLPVISGRIVKAKPILPDIFHADGAPEISGDAGKAIRKWTVTCDPAQLAGAPVGITSLDVLLTIETLDGRRHVQQLRPTQAYFVIPQPPTVTELALGAGRRGAERLLRRPEMALLVLVSIIAGIRRREFVIALVAFAAAQGLGSWLAGQRWMLMSAFLPQAAAAGAAWIFATELLNRPVLRRGWLRPLPVPMLVIGVLYGAAQPETQPTMGLSAAEQNLSLIFFAAGVLAGLFLLALCARQLRFALTCLPALVCEQWKFRVAYSSAVLAGGVFFYRACTPFFSGGAIPAVPLVTLVAAAALALWFRRVYGAAGRATAIVAAAGTVGVIVSFHGTLPLASLAVHGLLALVGAQLLFSNRWPLPGALSIIALTALYQGFHAGRVLNHETALPVANARSERRESLS